MCNNVLVSRGCARRAGHCWLHFLLIYVICIAIATNSDLTTNTSKRGYVQRAKRRMSSRRLSWKLKKPAMQNANINTDPTSSCSSVEKNTHCCLIEEIHARPSLSTLASAVFHPLSLLFLWLLYLLLPQFLFSILVVFVADHPLNTRIVREKSK